jgi:hypothetical protein
MAELDGMGPGITYWVVLVAVSLAGAFVVSLMVKRALPPARSLWVALSSALTGGGARIASLVGFAIALSSGPVFAVRRNTVVPRRRAFRSAKLRPGTEETTPPRSSVPSGRSGPVRVHPAIHGPSRTSAEHRVERLFVRATSRTDFDAPVGGPVIDRGGPESPGGPRGRDHDLEKELAKRRHPAGKGLRSKSAADEPSPGRQHTVRRGETLWSIAADVLGTDDIRRIARFWPLIHRANRDIVGRDPSLIFPGQRLAIPDERGPSDQPGA